MRRLVMVFLASALLTGVVLSVLTARSEQPPPNRGSRSEQRDFLYRLDQARKDLFRATLISTNPEVAYDLVAGESDLFTARVEGGRESARAGEAATDARAGAQIGMKLRCSGAVTCTALSSERQSVLTQDDGVEWVWKVTAGKEGTAEFALTMTAYYLDTTTVLFEKPVVSRTEVAPKPVEDRGWFAWAGDLYGWLTRTVEGLGALAGSLAAVVGLIVAVRALRGRRSGGADEDPAAPTGTADEDPAGPTRTADDREQRPAARSRPTRGS